MDAYGSNAIPDEEQYPIKQPPKWLRRPAGATFGFGGKLVLFSHQRPDSQTQHQHINTPKVKMTTLHDNDIIQRASSLQYAKIDHQLLLKFVDQKCQQASVNDPWPILKILFAENAREQLVTYLGLDKQSLLSQNEVASAALQSSPPSPSPLFNTIGTTTDQRTTTLSGIFRSDNGGSAAVATTAVTGDDFFASTNPSSQPTTEHQTPINSARDRHITQAVATGDFETAVALCLEEETRMADALLFAVSGGPDLFSRTRRRYLERQTQVPSMQLLDHLVRQDLLSFVQNSHVDDWKLVLAMLCTFAPSDEFGGLCEALGLRLETAAASLSMHGDVSLQLDNTTLPHPDQLSQRAAACYLASGKLERLLPIWVRDLQEIDKVSGAYLDGLQDFMEKVTVFLSVIEFEDISLMDSGKRGTVSMAAATKDYQYMDLLYGKYCEYAAFLASNGQLDTAAKYIGLVPEIFYNQPNNNEMAVIRDRICGATIHHGGMLLYKERNKCPFGTQHVILDSKSQHQQDNTIHLKKKDNDTGYSQHRLSHRPSLSMLPLPPHQLFYGKNQQRLNDSTSDTLFMTARDIPYFETINSNNGTAQQQENHFFDSITSKTESPTTLYDDKPIDEYAGAPRATNDDGFLDMHSLSITSPMTLQSSDTENIDYFDKGPQQPPRHHQHKPLAQPQTQQQQQHCHMDAPATPPVPVNRHQAHETHRKQQTNHYNHQDHRIQHDLSSFSPEQTHSPPQPSHQHQQGSPKTKFPQHHRQEDIKSTSPTTMYTSPVETRNYASNTNHRAEKLSPYHHRTLPRDQLYRSPPGNAQEKRRPCKTIDIFKT